MTDLPPRARDVAMVFQSYALYPHMTVRQNLGYGLKVRKTPKQEIRERVTRAAELLGLDQLLDRRPAALSGGQRQRVAMGRAIVREPKAFLMDEPLSNLDAKLRVSMRAQLSALHARLSTTTIYVTHDQIEAMTLGQRVAVMRDGRIQQVDTPQALYARPANLFVAAFIGSPAMNLVEAEVADGELRFGGYAIPLPAAGAPSEGQVVAGIRPEAFEDSAFADPSLPRIDVQVEVVEELGADTHVIFSVGGPARGGQRGARGGRRRGRAHGRRGLALHGARRSRDGGAARLRPLRLAVDPSHFHYFDPETGLRLEPESPTAHRLQSPLARPERERRRRTRASRTLRPARRSPAKSAGSSSARWSQSEPHSQRNSPGRSGSAEASSS